MNQTIFSRQNYLSADNQSAAHRRYYAQFVTPAVTAAVLRQISEAALRGSTDPHLNDIPLSRWDALEPTMRRLCLSRMGDVNGEVRIAGGSRSIAWSLSDAVCIAKEAARQWVEANP